MRDYTNKTREELLEIIHELEAKQEKYTALEKLNKSNSLHLHEQADQEKQNPFSEPPSVSDCNIPCTPTVIDNTQHDSQQQQDEIARLNSLMAAILDNIPVYLFVKNVKEDFRYLYWNKEFVKHSGIPTERALGKTDFEIFPNAEDMEKFRRDDLETMALGLKECEEDYTSANGEKRVVYTTKLPVKLPNGDFYLIGISWDITDLKKSQAELIAAREQAEESDRLKSAFLANMSHEIRTPLNAIVGFARLVIDSTATEEDKEDYCQIIERNSDLLLNLFNDIIDLSTLEAGAVKLSRERINLHALCQKEYNTHCNKLSQGVCLKLADVNRELHITSDKLRLEQVLRNLLSNAVKFTTTGQIRFGYEQRGNMVQFYVKDSGVGIPSNRIATIFQRFGKVNNFAQGTGLGLTICRMLIEHMGGRIWARSKENIGTTFYFTLPLI